MNGKSWWKPAVDQVTFGMEKGAMKRQTTLVYWPTFLHPIFLSIGLAKNGRQLHPNVLKDLPKIDSDLLDGHTTGVEHITAEAGEYGGNHYQVRIAGPRITGEWAFRSGELANLAREAVSTLNVR
jgi:hypothetical protein